VGREAGLVKGKKLVTLQIDLTICSKKLKNLKLLYKNLYELLIIFIES
jgi:hypothetical protein